MNYMIKKKIKIKVTSTGEPKTGPSTLCVTSLGLHRREGSHLSTHCKHFPPCHTGCCWPSLSQSVHVQLGVHQNPHIVPSKAASAPRALNSIRALKTIKAPVNDIFFFITVLYSAAGDSCFNCLLLRHK